MLAVEQRDAEALLEAEDIERRHGWVENPADGSWVAPKAQALARLGRLDEALEILEEELRRAWRWGAPGTTGPILRVIGQLRGEEGLDDLEEAAALLERSPRRLERAWAQAALGEGLLRAGREEAARDALHRAYALATVCSAKALTERIVAQLRTAGGEPRPATGADALTNTERRAAELAAEGRDDREVAQAMFLTPHAVQVRLDAAQRKLGIADRAQLAGALAH
jgi:DNA-binding CsgD family transcriptional regulator